MSTSEKTFMEQDVSKQLAITSRLVQNYRLATPFTPGKKIRYYMATAFNTNREAVLFSIGSNGAVNYIYPDDASDTGWSCTDLSFPGKANYITAANIGDGSIVIFASGTDNQLYSLYGDLLARKWIPVAGDLPYASTGLATCFDGDGNPFLVSFRGYAPYFYITPYTVNDWHSAGEGSNNDSIFDWCPAYFPASFDEKNFTNTIGYYASRTTIHAIGDRGMLGIAFKNAYSRDLMGDFAKVTVARNNKGYDEPFVVFEKDQGLYYLYVQNANSNTYAMQKLSGDIAVDAILGGNAYNGMMEVYALSTEGHLFHTRQDSTADSGWSDLTLLTDNYQFTDLIDGHNPDGYTDVFALTTEGDLIHLWQDPNSLEWHFEEVELGAGPLEEYSGYNIQLTVYDNNQVVAAQTGIHIYADSPTSVQINGKMVWLDKESCWQGTTNESGIVELAVKTESLGIPVLRAWADFLPPHDRVLINAGGAIQQRLSTIDDAGNDLLNAQITEDDGSTQPLVQGDDNRKQVEAISRSVKAAMTVLLPPDPPTTRSMYLHKACNPYVASYVTGDQEALQPEGALYSNRAEQYWNICFSGNASVYTVFTAEEAAAWYEKRQSLENIARSGGFHFDWGDLIASIKNGIAKLVEVTVSATVEGVKLALQIVINGVNYLFDTFVKHLNQLFEVVEEIFDKIQVTFDKIYRWLGLILNWNDITNTQQVIAYGINQLFEVQKAALQKVEEGINQFFTDARSLANSSFAQLINNTQMNSSFLTKQQTLPAAPVSTDDGNHNIVYSALMNNIGNGTTMNDSALHKTEVKQVVDDIILLLTREAEGFVQNPAFSQAVTYFENASRQPDQLLQNTMAGILSILQGISDCTLQIFNRIAITIVEALIALVNLLQQLLTATWDVPLLSQLFTKFCNGQELNFINLIALLIAVPVTTTYKIKFSAAPYPDQKSVDTFKNLFSAHAILVAAGIITGEEVMAIDTPNLSEEEVADALQIASIVLGVAGFYGSLVATRLNTVLDALPPDSDKFTPSFTRFLSTLTCTLTFLLQLSAIPWPFTNVGLPPVGGFNNWTAKEFENTIWVLQWLGIGVDGIFLWQYGKLAGQSEDPGVCISTMFGLINLSMFVILAIWEQNNDPMKTAQNIIGAVPGSIKILRLKPVVKLPPPGISLLVLAAVDFVCGYIAASLSLVRTFKPNDNLAAGKNPQPVMVFS
jgi:hypothetical protein